MISAKRAHDTKNRYASQTRYKRNINTKKYGKILRSVSMGLWDRGQGTHSAFAHVQMENPYNCVKSHFKYVFLLSWQIGLCVKNRWEFF